VDLEGTDPVGTPVLVQCKQYAPHRSVSGPEVRNFLGALWQHQVPAGLVVTTGSFTGEARTAADGKPVTLIDGTALVALARRAMSSSPPQTVSSPST
jgi:restriction system protein